jgi:hypothetical protein
MICPQCGGPVPEPGIGRPRRFCSDGCRRRWHSDTSVLRNELAWRLSLPSNPHNVFRGGPADPDDRGPAMTPAEAYRRCQQACDLNDESAAEFWLLVLRTLLDEAEDRRIAQSVRDVELYVMAQSIEWRWEVE